MLNMVTVVNFIRAYDDRMDMYDAREAVKNQVNLAMKYKMPTTFLYQPDALTDDFYVNIVPDEDFIEKGLWLELNKDLVMRAGGIWKGGDKLWDWHSDVDLTCAYPPDVRINMIDIAMEDFKLTFGYYPKTVGSWLIDALSLEYMDKKYHVQASLNCKDQWLTDGYSLWGGYYSQAFYPSKKNAFCPAGNRNSQINIPIFRMLGACPINQYDCESDDNGQNVISMEPSYPESGANEKWVRWFIEQMTKNDPVSFSYVQVGQENSFGWNAMREGYTMQMKVFDEFAQKGMISFMTMSEAGNWYKEHYAVTPASVCFAENDSQTALWYSNRNYRIGLYADNEVCYIRDIMMFDDNYEERYLNNVCTEKNSYYDNLPVADGYRWSSVLKSAGVFFVEDGETLRRPAELKMEKLNTDDVLVHIIFDNSEDTMLLKEEEIVFNTYKSIQWVFPDDMEFMKIAMQDGMIEFKYNGYSYKIKIFGKVISNNMMISPIDGKIIIRLV